MNSTAKTRFSNYVKLNRSTLLSNLYTGANRSDEQKESNYEDMLHHLAQATVLGATATDVNEAVTIFTQVTSRTLEVKKPPTDNGAARKLNTLEAASSDCRAVLHGVNVRLDEDQLKHQAPSQPIGTRQKGGGNRFINTCDRQWHIDTTLEHMATWASGLGVMVEGQITQHGQAVPVNQIHYEGYCLMASNGTKYVVFHCYPSNGSDLKL